MLRVKNLVLDPDAGCFVLRPYHCIYYLLLPVNCAVCLVLTPFCWICTCNEEPHPASIAPPMALTFRDIPSVIPRAPTRGGYFTYSTYKDNALSPISNTLLGALMIIIIQPYQLQREQSKTNQRAF